MPNRTDVELIRDLQELVDALDRRLPRLLHLDEPGIAKDAERLREKTVTFLDRLKRAPPADESA